jgi:DNA-binding NarL/FixJ family response regulator
MTPTRVHISEDSRELRTVIRRWLERDARLEVVGEAATGEEALRGVAATQPDVALLDLSMPRSLGLGMIAAVRERSPQTRVLVVTGTALETARQVIDEADGFLLKPAPMPELADLVCSVAAGSRVGFTAAPGY